jgi:hypothetical protein
MGRLGDLKIWDLEILGLAATSCISKSPNPKSSNLKLLAAGDGVGQDFFVGVFQDAAGRNAAR